MKKLFLIFSFPFASYSSFAQISGNRVYAGSNGERNYNYSEEQPLANNGIVVERDSVMYINTSVLLNTKADHYLLVLGINQVAKTTKECLDQLNARITGFIASAASNSIKKQDVFVDFITETKVYNYDFSTMNEVTVGTQKQTGIQAKKNINIRFDNIEILDQLLEKAAAFDIYDIIKVDYVIDDMNAIHKQMYAEANRIINEKKAGYLKSSAFELMPFYNVNTDNFYGIYPSGQYRSYVASESEIITANNYPNGSFIRKDGLPDKTYFYEGVNVATFDEVINGGTPYIGVQFVLNYGIKYYIKRK